MLWSVEQAQRQQPPSVRCLPASPVSPRLAGSGLGAAAGADMSNAVVDRVIFDGSNLKGVKLVNAVVTGGWVGGRPGGRVGCGSAHAAPLHFCSLYLVV